MKQILYSLLLFSVIISNAHSKNIDSLRTLFEKRTLIDQPVFKAYESLVNHYINLENDSCLIFANQLIAYNKDSAFYRSVAFRNKANYFKSIDKDSAFKNLEKSLWETAKMEESIRKWRSIYFCYDLMSYIKKEEKTFMRHYVFWIQPYCTIVIVEEIIKRTALMFTH